MPEGVYVAVKRCLEPQERSLGYRGNVSFLLKLNFKLVSDHPESGRSETQLEIECPGRGGIVAKREHSVLIVARH